MDVYFAAALLTERETESNWSSVSILVKDKSIAVTCVLSNAVGLSGKATALIYAIYPFRMFYSFSFIFSFRAK